MSKEPLGVWRNSKSLAQQYVKSQICCHWNCTYHWILSKLSKPTCKINYTWMSQFICILHVLWMLVFLYRDHRSVFNIGRNPPCMTIFVWPQAKKTWIWIDQHQTKKGPSENSSPTQNKDKIDKQIRLSTGIYFFMIVCLWCLSNLFTTFFMRILRIRFGVWIWAHRWRLHGDLFLNFVCLIVSGCCLVCIFFIFPLISS